MNTKRILGLGFLVALSACKAQCSCNGDDGEDGTGVGGTGGSNTITVGVGVTGSTSGSGGAGGADGTGGAGTGGDVTSAGGGGGAPQIVDPLVRFINVSSNAGDLNFCLQDDDGEFYGPLEGALTSPAVSDYTEVPVGNYAVIIIAADAACDDADGIVSDSIPLGDKATVTFGAIGNTADDSFGLAQYNDQITFPGPGSTKLRFVHAASGAPPVDIGEYVDSQFVPYFTGATYPEDAGYTNDLPAFTGATLTARAAGTETDLLDIPGVDGPDTAIVNAYAVGNVTDGVDVFIFNDFPAE